MMKKIFIFILLLALAISCSSTGKFKSLRRLDDIDRLKKRVANNNEKAIVDFIDAANNGNREVRASALWVLADNKIEVAYSDFLRLSREDADFNVRAIAIYGLSKLDRKTPETIDAIKRSINDTDVQVQIEAIKACGVINSEEFISPLLNSLSSKNRWIKLATIESLKDYNDKRIDSSLNSLSKTETDYSIRSLLYQVIEYRTNKGII